MPKLIIYVKNLLNPPPRFPVDPRPEKPPLPRPRSGKVKMLSIQNLD